jgi:hypothetical protein
MRKLILTSLIAIIALVGSGYFVLWNIAAEHLRERITGAATDEVRGLGLSYESFIVSGFPLWLRAEIDQAHLHGNIGLEFAESGPSEGHIFDWHTDRLIIEIRPWRPLHVLLQVPSPHPSALRIRLPGSQPPWAAITRSAAATLILDRRGQIEDIEFTATGIEHQEPVSFSGGRIDSLALRARLLDSGTGTGGRSFETSVSALEILLPAWTDNPLGRNIESIVLMGQLTYGHPGRRPGKPPWAEIERIDLRWGALEMLADGAVALRHGEPPEGKLTAEIRGFNETVEALAFARVISRDDARTAKTALSMLARRTPGNDVPTLSVALTASDGKLYVGPFALLRLPPLTLDSESAEVAE